VQPWGEIFSAFGALRLWRFTPLALYAFGALGLRRILTQINTIYLEINPLDLDLTKIKWVEVLQIIGKLSYNYNVRFAY